MAEWTNYWFSDNDIQCKKNWNPGSKARPHEEKLLFFWILSKLPQENRCRMGRASKALQEVLADLKIYLCDKTWDVLFCANNSFDSTDQTSNWAILALFSVRNSCLCHFLRFSNYVSFATQHAVVWCDELFICQILSYHSTTITCTALIINRYYHNQKWSWAKDIFVCVRP